ncbi:MAG: hypothetical protein DRI40_08435 [Chloroflexi bacterium]|nr:MAG: hypothetical protein DRI40_08435 [Chloroflexota bacterium]
MSWLAVEKAKELHLRYPGLSGPPVDIESMAEAEGLEWLSWPFLHPVKEVKRGRWVGLAQNLSRPEQRYLLAHALAHHLLHVGNQLSFHHQQFGMVGREEREAEVCAAHILMPGEELTKVIAMSLWDLADYFGVPEELAYHRISDYATQEEKERWDKVCYDGYV